NYKMLDQLLLRSADRPLWSASAQSLRYLVLDEFHTYDGAQGTDVAMLLRRLGMVLAREAGATPNVVPVATSATLGDKGDPVAMLDFARTVFGVDFEPDSVVTESRLSIDEWADSRGRGLPLKPRSLDRDTVDAVLTASDTPDPVVRTQAVLRSLY